MSALARRMSTQQALALPSPAASNTVVINARCSLRIEAGQRVIIVTGLPVHHYCAEDAVAEAYAMVFLVESGFAQQTDVARAFARSERTVRRTGWPLQISSRMVGVVAGDDVVADAEVLESGKDRLRPPGPRRGRGQGKLAPEPQFHPHLRRHIRTERAPTMPAHARRAVAAG